MPTTNVHMWIDPSCPWNWQTARWLHDLESRGVVRLTYGFFSLEVNAAGPHLPFAQAAPTYGGALAALALARREGGPAAVAALYTEVGRRLHEDKRSMSDALLVEAAPDAGLGDLVERAQGPLRDDLGREILDEYLAARERDVFGVPTLAIEGDKVVYGPIIALAPTGEDALALWDQVKGLAGRGTFFELKRWPRDVRPGQSDDES